MARSGREVVEALIATLNAGDVPGMDDVFHEDAEMVWPQSGERIVGGDNRRAVYSRFPQLPKIDLRRLTGDGDLWVAEADLD
ncbi:nuclear transport factor 2 family protein [Microbacterium sp. HJ5]